MRTSKISALYDKYCIPVYNRNGVAVARAAGSWVWDAEGRKYLDLFPGWGVNSLGHCHPLVVGAVRRQAKLLMHVPNTFYNEPQAVLAEGLVKAGMPGKAFFANSGAEAVEAAIKLARRFGRDTGRFEIITMEGSFHGRTMGALAATGQAKYQKGFEPMLPGFTHVPFNDLGAVERAVGPKTAAVMLEPVQGEGGIHIAEDRYMKGLRRLCDERKLLLIADEVSSGMGRTGAMYAFQRYKIVPDMLLLGKGIAGGPPLGVLIAGRHISDLWEKASHATTFGGNPLVAAAGAAALEAIVKGKLLANVRAQGKYIVSKLESMRSRLPVIREVRGAGLMIGVELDRPGAAVVKAALCRGLLINVTQDRVIRMYPAFTISRKEIDRGLALLEESLKELG